MVAALLSAICLWFSWRSFERCKTIARGASEDDGHDPFESRLLARGLNLELVLAKRNVRALGRTALFGGGAVAFWMIANGELVSRPRSVWSPALLGMVGWGGCRELERRIGSLADAWRLSANRRQRRQGVDQSERTG